MNSTALKLLLAAGVAILAFAPSHANAAATGSISGTIQGEPTGDICARDVGVYDAAGTRVAGIDGYTTLWYDDDYEIEGLEPGEYRLSFEQSCVDRIGPLPGGGPVTHMGEFFNDSPTLEDATTVSVVGGTETTGVDVVLGLGNPIEWETSEPEPGAPEARINVVKVAGPTTIRKGNTTMQKLKIRNSGDLEAKRVRLWVKGRGINYRARMGSIPAGTMKIVRFGLTPGKSGRTTVKFKVTSSNAGSTSLERSILVK